MIQNVVSNLFKDLHCHNFYPEFIENVMGPKMFTNKVCNIIYTAYILFVHELASCEPRTIWQTFQSKVNWKDVDWIGTTWKKLHLWFVCPSPGSRRTNQLEQQTTFGIEEPAEHTATHTERNRERKSYREGGASSKVGTKVCSTWRISP